MFAKLISETQIEKAPRCIHIGNVTHVLPTPEEYAEAGYYEVIEQEAPEDLKWYDLISTYELKENKIYQGWDYVKQPKPDYAKLIVSYIREMYSLNDELALQRQKDNSQEKEEEFSLYNSYCETCKQRAKADLTEWEKA